MPSAFPSAPSCSFSLSDARRRLRRWCLLLRPRQRRTWERPSRPRCLQLCQLPPPRRCRMWAPPWPPEFQPRRRPRQQRPLLLRQPRTSMPRLKPGWRRPSPRLPRTLRLLPSNQRRYPLRRWFRSPPPQSHRHWTWHRHRHRRRLPLSLPRRHQRPLHARPTRRSR